MPIQVSNLKTKPHLLQATLQLIERSFNYQAPFQFQEDFAPLIDSSNHHNCFILINDDDEVLAHIGFKERTMKINDELISLGLLGGIAVAENHRGEGHFQTLMQDILSEKRDEVAFFILWSDLEKLYNKFGFYLCGQQYALEQVGKTSDYQKTKFHLLDKGDQESVKSLYQNSFGKVFLTLDRDQKDWELIAKTTSSDLFIRKSAGKITDYFFMNKGQDLPGIIYEYGSERRLEDALKEIRAYGKVWMGKELLPSQEQHLQFFLSPANPRLFSRFILGMTNGKVTIRDVSFMKQEVYFYFNEELLGLPVDEFLQGVLGPGIFEEWEQDLKAESLFFSGLDSI